MRISAETAEEDRRSGRKADELTPYWRVIKDDGSLNPKFPGGVRAQTQKLIAEGHSVKGAQGRRAPKVIINEWTLLKFE